MDKTETKQIRDFAAIEYRNGGYDVMQDGNVIYGRFSSPENAWSFAKRHGYKIITTAEVDEIGRKLIALDEAAQ